MIWSPPLRVWDLVNTLNNQHLYFLWQPSFTSLHHYIFEGLNVSTNISMVTARKTYLQCVSTGVTSFLHWTIDMVKQRRKLHLKFADNILNGKICALHLFATDHIHNVYVFCISFSYITYVRVHYSVLKIIFQGIIFLKVVPSQDIHFKDTIVNPNIQKSMVMHNIDFFHVICFNNHD